RGDEEAEQRGAGEGPEDEPGHFVDGEMAERSVVAVVEPGELRGHDPDRRGEHDEERAAGAASPEPDCYCRPGHGRNVGGGEHAAEEALGRVAGERSTRSRALRGLSSGRSANQVDLAHRLIACPPARKTRPQIETYSRYRSFATQG